MNKTEFFNLLKQHLNLNHQQINQFEIYKSFLQEQNKVMNLTRLATEDKIYHDYFYEGIIPYLDYDFNDLDLLDIGSGNGNPGVILKILFPQMRLTIIEANKKKCEFIKLLAIKLNIDIRIINQRAEEINNSQRETFDIVTSRAVAEFKILVEISTPYLKVGGLLIEPKSKNAIKEIDMAKIIMSKVGLKMIGIKKIIDTKEHFIIICNKELKTNMAYPRIWKEIIK